MESIYTLRFTVVKTFSGDFLFEWPSPQDTSASCDDPDIIKTNTLISRHKMSNEIA